MQVRRDENKSRSRTEERGTESSERSKRGSWIVDITGQEREETAHAWSSERGQKWRDRREESTLTRRRYLAGRSAEGHARREAFLRVKRWLELRHHSSLEVNFIEQEEDGQKGVACTGWHSGEDDDEGNEEGQSQRWKFMVRGPIQRLTKSDFESAWTRHVPLLKTLVCSRRRGTCSQLEAVIHKMRFAIHWNPMEAFFFLSTSCFSGQNWLFRPLQRYMWPLRRLSWWSFSPASWFHCNWYADDYRLQPRDAFAFFRTWIR